MKTICKACKGERGNKSCKACKGAGFTEYSSDSSSEDMDMKKASEILKGLRDYVGEDEARRIVKAKIGAGEAFDDLATASLDVDALDAAVDAMKASLSGDYLPDDHFDDVVKGGTGFDDLVDYDGRVDIGDLANRLADNDANVAKGINTLSYANRANHEVVSKGLLAMARLVRDQNEIIKGQAAALDQIQRRQDQIAKAMSLPVPPRSVLTGASAVPAPYEGEVAKGGAAPAQATEASGSVLDVYKAAKAELGEIMKAGPVMDINKKQRAAELSSAIARCESAVPGQTDAAELARQFNIAV